MFEKLVFNQLYSYLSISHNHQSGFRLFLQLPRPRLLDATNEWHTNIDNGFLNTVVFLDLTKAFDTVDHKILLSKLELITMYKILHSGAPSHLNDQFTRLSETNQYYLRGRETKVVLPQPKTEDLQLRCSFKFRVVQKWNDLPDHLRSINTLEDFKLY